MVLSSHLFPSMTLIQKTMHHPHPRRMWRSLIHTMFSLKVFPILIIMVLSLLLLGTLPQQERFLQSRGQQSGIQKSTILPSKVTSTEFRVSSKSHQDPPDLEIAWLMSFPNSGTSYTIKTIRHLSQTLTASNYGHENTATHPSIPVFASHTTTNDHHTTANNSVTNNNGPFWMEPMAHPEYALPRRYVLTKTHCGMRCVTCGPMKYVETTFSFRRNCASGQGVVAVEEETTPLLESVSTTPQSSTPDRRHSRRILDLTNTTYTTFRYNRTVNTIHTSNGHSNTTIKMIGQMVSYSPHRVSKAIHLIRNPFDNVVSRFHLERKVGKSAQQYPKTVQGFRDFCRALDEDRDLIRQEQKAPFLDASLLELLRHVPCRGDFIRYIEWHNLAFATTSDMELDTYVLHYDWYATRFEKTLQELLDFLELTAVSEPEPFLSGKFYERDHFTLEERQAVRTAFQAMALKTAWQHIERYFPEYYSSGM